MSDLAEFMLARIADEEAWVARDAGSVNYDYERGALRGLGELGAVYSVSVLAECEAKRRIVERYQRILADREVQDPYTQAESEIPMEETVKDLALPYVDHPAFREEWRV